MRCPKCGAENPEGKKFCRKCGAKLVVICTNCKADNDPEDSFCGECGHILGVSAKPTPKELTFDEKLQKIQKYLPGGLTEKILSQREKIEGERKQVTVMFCDMEGFTPLVEKLGPEEAYAMMDQVYEILIHKVHDYEGTVNEMTGDGVMALFGAPIALEDAPQRAIRSAMAIHQEMTRFNDRMRQEKGEFPAAQNADRDSYRSGGCRHTGQRSESGVQGGGRYGQPGLPDGTLPSRGPPMSPRIPSRLTEGLFRFEALGEKEIKGKEKPLKVYQVIAPSSRRTRFDVSAERGLTTFVGRQRELELLLDGFDRAKAGRGQAFSIICEAGSRQVKTPL